MEHRAVVLRRNAQQERPVLVQQQVPQTPMRLVIAIRASETTE
jgi:hypothetical protein